MESIYFILAKAIIRDYARCLVETQGLHPTTQEVSMPKFSTEGKYLKHAELDGQDWVLTIDRVKQEVVGKDEDATKKWVVYFKETEKGFVLNATNGKTICKILGTEEMDEWLGRKITLYVKDDVEFGGEMVSAIRVRPKLPA